MPLLTLFSFFLNYKISYHVLSTNGTKLNKEKIQNIEDIVGKTSQKAYHFLVLPSLDICICQFGFNIRNPINKLHFSHTYQLVNRFHLISS